MLRLPVEHCQIIVSVMSIYKDTDVDVDLISQIKGTGWGYAMHIAFIDRDTYWFGESHKSYWSWVCSLLNNTIEHESVNVLLS